MLFVLTGCLPKTNERVLFKPINPSLLGEKPIISYTIKEEITTTQSETFTQRLNDDFMNNNILVKYFELKDLVSGLESIPENSNLWIVVNWYDYYEALQEGLIDYNKFIKPDGYNITDLLMEFITQKSVMQDMAISWILRQKMHLIKKYGTQ